MHLSRDSKLHSQLNNIVDHLRSNIAIIDETGMIVMVNQSWRDFSINNGASPEDVSEGKNYLEICYSAKGADQQEAVTFAKGIEAVLAGEKNRFSLDYPCHTPSRERWFSGKLSTFGNDGRDFVIVDHVDITERKALESQLRKTEEKNRNILEKMQVGFAYVDMEGRILEANPAFCRLTGYRSNELTQLTYKTLTPQKWHAIEAQIVENQIIPLGFSDAYEKEYRRKTGEIVPIRLKTYLDTDSNGCPVGMYAFVHDITRRKRAEQKLSKSEQRFEQVVANAAEWVWEVDATGLYTYSSPAVHDIMGYKTNQVVGIKHFHDFFVPGEKANLKNEAFELFSPKKTFRNFLNCNRHRDGRDVWLSTSGMPLFDDSGRPIGFRGVHAEVTALIESNQKLKQSNDELGKIVQQRDALHDDTHAAIKVLINQREHDKADIENNLVATVKDLILPYINQLKNTSLNDRQRGIAALIESNLHNIVRPFAKQLSSRSYGLTPTEIKVAHLVRDGRTNKEIANLLNVSVSTILTHRHHLRDKLDLTNKKANLRSHLLSLQ